MTNIQELFDRLPSAQEGPANATPSRMTAATPAISRRRVLGLIAGTAVASGLAALDVLPWSKPRNAYAALQQHGLGDCRGYFDSATICVPSNALYDSHVCSGSWHKDKTEQNPNYQKKWTPAPRRCDGKNAWRWTRGTRRKCSDGDYYYFGRGIPTPIERMSICRTAI
jgi:hypothetical protein